jgi:hypothetical protein
VELKQPVIAVDRWRGSECCSAGAAAAPLACADGGDQLAHEIERVSVYLWRVFSSGEVVPSTIMVVCSDGE